MSGKELINGIKAGSNEVWKHLFSSPAEAMRRQLGPVMKDVRDVTFDDVFEEACIVLMENVKAGKLDEEGLNLEGYLYTICKRIAFRYAGKKRPVSMDSGSVSIKDEGGDQAVGTPDEEARVSELVEAFFDKVLSSMPANQRAVLKHFYWDKMPMSEIASLCGFKNENVAKSTKNRYMENFKRIARQMLDNDEIADEAIARAIERASLRSQLDECRHLESGVLAASACKEGKAKLTEKEIVDGIRNNSPVVWKALYANLFAQLQKDISPILE